MGVLVEMDESSPKKRKAGDEPAKKKKAKRKKVSADEADHVAFQQVAMLGEIPSLFHMQIEELLKEVKMKKMRQQKLADCIEKLKDVLLNMKKGKEHKIHAQKWLKGIQLPVVQEPATTKGCFEFQAPTRVFVGGSAVFNINVDPDQTVDLFLEMPQNCLQAKDCFNHRYTRKRALYLAAVALRLSKVKMVEDMKFTYHHGNTYKPLLVLHVAVPGNSRPLVLHLHAVPEEGVFKLSRFNITQNNIRPRWFAGQEESDVNADGDDGETLPETPFYNSTILQDVCYEANASFLAQHLASTPSVQDGIALLKVWIHQRDIHAGAGGFGGFLMSMYVCHLLSVGKVRPSMTAFQVLRTTLFQLSNSNWISNPVSLCTETGTGKRPDMADFQKAFDIVFVDVTGYLNLCLGMTKAVYNRVVHEARIAAAFLNSEAQENFDLLLMTSCPFRHTFDLIFSLKLTAKSLKTMTEKLELRKQAMDNNQDLVATVMPRLLAMLEQGLGDRVVLLQPQIQAAVSWPVTESPPSPASDCTLTFGLVLHKSNSLRLLDRGPPANSDKAAQFREFWGSKSELRRFKDGGICEAVVWSFTSGMSQKRQVCSKIIAHVLTSHTGIELEQIHTVGHLLESFLHVPRKVLTETAQNEKGKKATGNPVLSYGTGEERIYAIRQVLEELGRTLRNLEDLSLRINAVTGIDPAVRFTEVFPAHPAVPKLTSKDLLKHDVPALPLYTPAMTVICTLEGSGKWPEDVERIRNLKTLFLIDLGQKLSGLGLTVHVQQTFVDVLKNGFVFRLKLGVSREIGVLRMVRGAGGILKMEDTPESLAVEAEMTALPALTIALQGVQQEHPSFCASVRLVKRWMAAQMLLGIVPEAVAEKSVVHVFENPLPYTAPVSPVMGFVRTLKFIASPQWPAAVKSYCGKVCVSPAVVVMNWTQHVTAESLKVLADKPDSEWKVIFKPPLDVYDAVIHLSPLCQARHHQGVGVKDFSVTGYPVAARTPRSKFAQQAHADASLPVVSFNPAEKFLQDLQDAFGEFALFFHDVYGGDVVAVLLKPEATASKEVEVGNFPLRKVTVVDGEPALTFDFDAMLMGVSVRGQDMITKVDVHKKWQK